MSSFFILIFLEEGDMGVYGIAVLSNFFPAVFR